MTKQELSAQSNPDISNGAYCKAFCEQHLARSIKGQLCPRVTAEIIDEEVPSGLHEYPNVAERWIDSLRQMEPCAAQVREGGEPLTLI